MWALGDRQEGAGRAPDGRPSPAASRRCVQCRVVDLEWAALLSSLGLGPTPRGVSRALGSHPGPPSRGFPSDRSL